MRADSTGAALWAIRPSLSVAAAVSLALAAALASAGVTSAVTTEVDADLIRPGRLTICSSFPRVRFAELDADGEPSGVDIDVGLEIAARLGLEPEVRDVPFDTLIEDVVGRGCDVSIAGQFITEGRLALIDMIAYREGTPHVIVRAGDQVGIDGVEDLCGRSMAVVSGTVHVEIVHGSGDHVGRGIDDACRAAGRASVDLREYPSQEEAEDALTERHVDAYSGNDFVTVDRPRDFELSVALPPIRNGIGLRKGATALHGAIRGALGAMIADGTYGDILDRYDVSHAVISTPP